MVSRNDTNEFIRGFARSNGNSVECVEPGSIRSLSERTESFVPRFPRELEFVESACPRSPLFNFRLLPSPVIYFLNRFQTIRYTLPNGKFKHFLFKRV